MTHRFIGLLATNMLILALLLTGCGPSNSTPTAKPSSETATAATKVQVTSVKSGNLSSTLEYTGNVQTRQQVNLIPKVSGRVVKLAVDIGSMVKTGDVLLVIEKDMLVHQAAQADATLAASQARLSSLQAGPRDEQVAQAEANLKSAEARLAQVKAGSTQEQLNVAEAQLRLAQNQLYSAQTQADAMLGSRAVQMGASVYTKEMKEATSGVAYEQVKIAEANLAALKAGPSAETIAQAEAAVDVARQQLALTKQPATQYDIQAAQASVARDKAGLDLANLQLAEATVKAPFDGVISQKQTSEGAMVGPTAPVLTMISNNNEIVVNVDDRALAVLKPGQTATATVTTYDALEFPATVASISPTVDSKSRTAQVRFTPTDPEGKLRDGMFAQIKININTTQASTILVPKNAVTQDQGATIVYVVSDGVAKRQVVTTGASNGDEIEIVEGLSEGQTIVVSNLTGLRDGAEVTIQ